MPSAGALVRLVSFTRSWIFINVKEFIPTSSFVLSLLTSLALLKFAVNCWTRSRRNRKEVGGGKAYQDLFKLVTPASFCSLRVASHCLQDLLLGYVIQLVCTPNEEHRVTRAEGGTPKCPSCSQCHPRATHQPVKGPQHNPPEPRGRLAGRNSNQRLLSTDPPHCGPARTVPGQLQPSMKPTTPPAAKGGDGLGRNRSGKRKGKGAKRAGSSWLVGTLVSHASHPAESCSPESFLGHRQLCACPHLRGLTAAGLEVQP